MKMKNRKNNFLELEAAVLGGGCFWCLDAVFSQVEGVKSVTAGYAGGNRENPTYEDVSMGTTGHALNRTGPGHAEAVKVEFYPKIISFNKILNIFFSVHDPTTLNRQGNDIGSQYRSIILYDTQEQKRQAEKIIKKLEKDKIYDNPVVTEIKPLEKFYPAEEYHQNYFQKNPDQAYCQAIISPKVAKFRKMFQDYYK